MSFIKRCSAGSVLSCVLVVSGAASSIGCSAESQASSDEDLKIAAAVAEALFELLPGGAPGGGGGGIVIRKSGNVSCVTSTIAPPGGPASTSVQCSAEGSNATLRGPKAQAVFESLK